MCETRAIAEGRGRCRFREVEPLESKPAGERRDRRLLERDVVVRIEVVDARDAGARATSKARAVCMPDEARRAGHEDVHDQAFTVDAEGRSIQSRAGGAGPSPSDVFNARSFAYLRKLANAPMAMCAKPAALSRKPSFTT